MIRLLFVLVFVCFTAMSCSNTAEPDDGDMCLANLASIESDIETELNSYDSDTDFTVLLRSDSGRDFSFSIGNSSVHTSYRSASTSKQSRRLHSRRPLTRCLRRTRGSSPATRFGRSVAASGPRRRCKGGGHGREPGGVSLDAIPGNRCIAAQLGGLKCKRVEV